MTYGWNERREWAAYVQWRLQNFYGGRTDASQSSEQYGALRFDQLPSGTASEEEDERGICEKGRT